MKITARRETSAGVTVQSRYYISSLDAPAGKLLSAVRNHWSIENSLHWTLDVTFREDQCRVRKYHAPQNLATMRQISHNLLKNETSLKVGIQGNDSKPAGGRTTFSKSSSVKTRLPCYAWPIQLHSQARLIGANRVSYSPDPPQ